MQDPHGGGRYQLTGVHIVAGTVLAAGGLAAYLWMTRDVGRKIEPSVPARDALRGSKKVQEKAVESATLVPASDEDVSADPLGAALELKEKGNALLGKNGKEAEASGIYARALAIAEAGLSAGSQRGDVSNAQLEAVRNACLLNKAMAELKLGRWDAVVVGCTRAIELGGESTKALYRRATALINLNDLDGAVSDLRTANKAVKGSDTLVSQRLAKVCQSIADKAVGEARLDCAKEHYEEASAIAKFQKMHAVEYHCSMALGTIHRTLGQAGQAAAMFARAAEAAGASAATENAPGVDGVYKVDALMNRCIAMDQCSSALLASGQVDAAEQMIGAVAMFATLLGKMGQWAVDNANGRTAVILEIKGSAAVKAGDWRTAELSYTAMIEASEKLPDGWALSDGSEAQGTFGLSKASLRSDALMMLAFTSEMLSDVDKAQELFAEALGVAMGSQDARREGDVRSGLGTLFSRMGKPAEAVEQLKMAIDIGKRSGHISVVAAATGNLGKAYMMLKQTKEAVDCFREAYEMRMNSEDYRGACSQAINLGGGLCVLNSDRAEAEKYYFEALAIADQRGLVEMQAIALRSLINHFGDAKSIGGGAGDPKAIEKALAYRKRLVAIMDIQGRGQSGQCPITMERFGDDEHVMVLECYHMVQRGAWDTWAKRCQAEEQFVRCPVCNHKIMYYGEEESNGAGGQ